MIMNAKNFPGIFRFLLCFSVIYAMLAWCSDIAASDNARRPYQGGAFEVLSYATNEMTRSSTVLRNCFHSAIEFFTYYNTEHRHSGLGLLILAAREQTMWRAYIAPPRTFCAGSPAATRPAFRGLDQPTPDLG